MHRSRVSVAAILLASAIARAEPNVQNRFGIRSVNEMPNLPTPFEMRDWREVARGYDRLVFDENARGQYLPLIHFVRNKSGKVTEWGLPPYVGQNQKTVDGRPTNAFDGVATLGAIWGGTLIGKDYTKTPFNYVAHCEQFFNPKNGIGGNTIRTADPEKTLWYSLLPSIVLTSIADRYPNELTTPMQRCTRQWAAMVEAVKDNRGQANFNFTGFDFSTMKPVSNGHWQEPDSAAGIAFLQYVGYQRWRDPTMLKAMRDSLAFLDRRPAEDGPMYEILMPFGALAAARANAELKDNHDVYKMLNWSFDRSSVRPEWKVNTDRWAGFDVAGLGGGINTKPWRSWPGGYAFAMNTFVMAWPIVPIARYDPRYAHDIGKWMLNASNAARLFYANAHPKDRQSCPDWTGDPESTIAYEGLKFRWDNPEQGLFATGDPIHERWGPLTDFGLYGSSYVGVFGSIISRTEHPQILKLDLLATDVAPPKAYPSYLFYNPHGIRKSVKVITEDGLWSVYDAVKGTFLARNVTKDFAVQVPPDGAIVAVVVPADGVVTHSNGNTLVNGVVIDYRR